MATRERLQRELIELTRDLQGMCVFSRQYNAVRHARFEADIAQISKLTRRELVDNIERVARNVADARETMRPNVAPGYFADLYTDARVHPSDYVFFTKWQLHRLFRDPDEVFPDLRPLPLHTRISIDIHGLDAPGYRGEWRLLEAALYEDMCAHFNRAWTLREVVKTNESTRFQHKESAASRRGAVSTAFYLVEAFLNSLAYDHIVVQAGSYDIAARDLLTEWDSAKNRRKLVSFRDKLLHYPRVILGQEHPPLQENSSPAIAFLLSEAKEFRDSIVHANPRPTGDERHLQRESRFWQIGVSHGEVYRNRAEGSLPMVMDNEVWVKVVDTSLSVVRELEGAISGNIERLYWMHDRSPDGLFDMRVFD